jgi:hypothetical protein
MGEEGFWGACGTFFFLTFIAFGESATLEFFVSDGQEASPLHPRERNVLSTAIR